MARAAHRAEGKCECCGCRLLSGHYHYDHIIPDQLGGEPTLENCQVLCKACHGVKTAKTDVPNIAKAKRREARHIGAKPKSSRPLSDPRWKKLMNGEVVRRG